jgi:hypothetical protein
METIVEQYDSSLDPEIIIESYKSFIPKLSNYTFDRESHSIIIPDCDDCPTPDIILEKYQEIHNSKREKELKEELMVFCDNKQEEFQEMLLGYKATPLQLQRYIDKYERALKGEFDKNINDLIIQNHEYYQNNLRLLIDKIEYFRMPVDDLLMDQKFDEVTYLLLNGDNYLNTESTFEEIQAYLDSVQNGIPQ